MDFDFPSPYITFPFWYSRRCNDIKQHLLRNVQGATGLMSSEVEKNTNGKALKLKAVYTGRPDANPWLNQECKIVKVKNYKDIESITLTLYEEGDFVCHDHGKKQTKQR